MSAATMIACAADEIVLGKHSFLGPTDPQILVQTSLGMRAVPAQAVLDQFDPAKLSAWLPMLGQYGPDLLVQCQSALAMSKELVKTWLETYMFKEDPERVQKAESISNWLAGHANFKSHARHIPRTKVEEHRMNVYRLEDDQILQDMALSVFHATTHTLTASPAVKIVENHIGRAFIKQQFVQPMPAMQLGLVPPTPDGAAAIQVPDLPQ